jgi:hypothetical protein
MGLLDWLYEERKQYTVCDSPLAPSRDRLTDVLNKAGAKGVEPLDCGVGARAMLRPGDVGYIESNGFTVRLEDFRHEP